MPQQMPQDLPQDMPVQEEAPVQQEVEPVDPAQQDGADDGRGDHDVDAREVQPVRDVIACL